MPNLKSGLTAGTDYQERKDDALAIMKIAMGTVVLTTEIESSGQTIWRFRPETAGRFAFGICIRFKS
jgi:pSer/pThr/pTyr-binding forkhead associated (FHA) protein